MNKYINSSITEQRKILAAFDAKTIRVYQAYSDRIADEALKLGTFGSCFKMDRMTWIKPSFLWMMYRAGWGIKPGQERILAIDIDRSGFNTILANAILASFNAKTYSSHDEWKSKLQNSLVRCQWDPDRNIYGAPIDRRAIQLGIRGDMVKRYVNEWIVKISDITSEVGQWRMEIANGSCDISHLPKEIEYYVNSDIKQILGM
ncbi:MAG: hypothetical protein H6Q73_1142 [Firmicutes bacterium]|nr:hypothetical protein [Bacillota bacterium]